MPIAWPRQILLEPWRAVDRPTSQPVSESPPDEGPHVRILRIRGFAAKLHIRPLPEPELSEPVSNRAADTAAGRIHKQPRHLLAVIVTGQHGRGEGHQLHGVSRKLAGDSDRGDTLGIHTTPEAKDT